MIKRLKRWLILGHRWLGIVTCLFFALWIGSGLVMLYVPFPKLTEAERLSWLRPLVLDTVAITPDAALSAGRSNGPIPRLVLEMRGTEPVYRFGEGGERTVVSARTGAPLPPLDEARATGLAGGSGRAALIERDQWTVAGRYDALRPLYLVTLDDPDGTELYVSQRTGEIALDTTQRERGWNWVGAVVHWIYPTPLRAQPDLWRQVVLWTSGIAILGAASGLTIGIWRIGLFRRYPRGHITPYRGLARWHHLIGIVGGLALTSFIVSGWLSMNPNRWFASPNPPVDLAQAYAGGAAPIGLEAAALGRFAVPGAVEMRFIRVGGRWLVTSAARSERRSFAADGARLPDTADIAAAARRAFPEAPPPTVEWLSAYDAYWYPHHEERTLPVLRLRFDDPAATWLHVDPRDGTILNRLDASGRAYRWLFSALHCLDLPILLLNRPAWDIVQWLLNLLGAGIALTGLVIGWRRLVRPNAQRPGAAGVSIASRK